MPSQSLRVDGIISSLKSLDLNTAVIGLVEVENNKSLGNIGNKIAQQVAGIDGHWLEYDREAKMMGFFGSNIKNVQSYDISGNSKVFISEVGAVKVALTHLTYGPISEQVRYRQLEIIIDILNDSDKAVLMGDFNSASWQRSRKLLKKGGFVSVFEHMKRRHPSTVLTESYRHKLRLHYRIATKWGFSPDDIYVRNISVVDADVFEGDSDHRGVWASLSY